MFRIVAETLVNQFIIKYDSFKNLRSVNGTEFKNELKNNIHIILEIKQTFITSYRHQSKDTIHLINSFSENFHT